MKRNDVIVPTRQAASTPRRLSAQIRNVTTPPFRVERTEFIFDGNVWKSSRIGI